jgi:hypothetical protein
VSDNRKSPALLLVVPLAIALVAIVFAWPSARLEPRDLPVGVAGPPQATQAIEQNLKAQNGAFEIHRYADREAARQAIEDRHVYGAFVASPSGAEVLTASAASTTVAQLLTRAAPNAHVEDVVKAPSTAPAVSSLVLPMVLAGSLLAFIASLVFTRPLAQAGAVVAGAAAVGLAVVPIAQDWLDVVHGNWFADAGVFSLAVLATAAFVAGLHALFGNLGATLGAFLMIIIGNPFSGASSAPEMLPQPVGLIGQLMPPGAGSNLLRSTGYFDGAGAWQHVVVLAGWAALGLALLGFAEVRARISAKAGAGEQTGAFHEIVAA